MTGITAHIIPHKTMLHPQGMDAVFIFEVVWLILCPVCKVVRFIVCPDEISFGFSVAQSNPTLGTIQTVLYIDILFLTFNVDKVGVGRLTTVLSCSPVLA